MTPLSTSPPPSSAVPLATAIIGAQRYRIYGWLISLSSLGSSVIFVFLPHRRFAFMAEQYFTYMYVCVCVPVFFWSSPVSGCLNFAHSLDTVSNNGINMTDYATISFNPASNSLDYASRGGLAGSYHNFMLILGGVTLHFSIIDHCSQPLLACAKASFLLHTRQC